ncbi:MULTISPECIES: transcriptional regulator FtsR [Streptomyces]|uniref:MerR family transcriptional regulator n=1 Tax=Streptomyces virginiae TaxID=1961 RepID=A0ABQ3NKA9_STRVG|nr:MULTISPECIES: MerR family transcriptional regulator [Streptomyces]KOU18058.1 MerR family transcriptional regulator [Streptomyces sp. WM6349]KOV07083.1 MerR family transcriptional regulator [Streptomyces sp. XY533]KOV15211.1 MerR family transcriptional regulator [Streptomyces sp. XY511]KOV44067.1 MerR family transcriptional regulator [Streptomyces sp. H036]MBP2342896.1 DNA-binding transcriptional MerR regulator [Streptomyces virginiae]
MLRNPTGGAGNGSAGSAGRLVSIGTVLTTLRDEFPEVTISKIRFLEAEGLVEPRRTPSGYRKFSTEDVERLARILRLQRDHYLPLKVIREQLDALARGEQIRIPAPTANGDATDPADPAGPGAVYGEVGQERPPVARVGRAELLAAVGVDEDQLVEWESYGLLAETPGGGFDADAVTVARLVADLGRFGLEPRHLRAMKAAADREAGLVEQVVAPLRRHRNPQTRAHAEATMKELAGLSVRLHEALVQTALGVRLR